jgi:putative transposase
MKSPKITAKTTTIKGPNPNPAIPAPTQLIRRRSKFIVREQLKAYPLSYGGELLKSRQGRRRGGRWLDPKHTLHLVLRSAVAKGPWSFSRSHNKKRIDAILKKFAAKYNVRIFSTAYAGNHIHSQIQITTRLLYKKFIRAITGAIAMAVTGSSRWQNNLKKIKFWSFRPFTRIVKGPAEFKRLKNYIEINRLESRGYDRNQARFLIAWEQDPPYDSYPGSA